MSGSLHKKKNAIPKQKQNSNRLSNSKILQSYSSHAPLTKVAQLFHHQSTGEEKEKNNHRKTGKIKTNRKHQLSVEYILQNKCRQPYGIKSVQIFEKQKDKNKIKKKKRDGQNNQSNNFVIPVLEFSRSNSLIVFSQKDSTINGNTNFQRKKIFVTKPLTSTQAAIIIQKNWRGYLTRKLLQQYINEQETKLVAAMNYLKSKQQSFFEEKHQQMNFSDFSQIIEEANHHNERQTTQKSEMEGKSSFKRYQIVTTQHQSQRKQYTYSNKRFFGTKTQSDIQSSHKKAANFTKDKKQALSIHSSVINQTITKSSQKQKKNEDSDNLQQYINELKYFMTKEFKQHKCNLKLKLQSNKITMQDMMARNIKVKQIYQNSQQFLTNVFQELQAMLADISETVQHGGEPNDQEQQQRVRFQPKSEVFTFQADDSEPEFPASNIYTEGHVKIQSYLNDLLQDYHSNYNQLSELQYLCQILKINSQRGIKTMIERCLLQFTVQIITSNYPIDLLNQIAIKQQFGDSQEDHFVAKWINQLNKWEMGPIQEVTQAMQSSSLINQSTTTIH